MNVEPLDAAIAWIEKNPEQHDQSIWFCTTGMCVAGVICHLDPNTRIPPVRANYNAGFLVLVTDDLNKEYLVEVSERAAQILDVDEEYLNDGLHAGLRYIPGLFAGGNTINDIHEIRDQLVEELNT